MTFHPINNHVIPNDSPDNTLPVSCWPLGKESGNGSAAVGNGDGAGAGDEFVGGIDAEGGVDGGVEIGDADGVFETFFGEIVGGSIGASVFEPSAGED